VTGADVLRAVVRHPVIFIVCMVVALGACATVWYAVPTTYTAQSSLVLLPPEVIITSDGTKVRVNPWQEVGDNASQVTASALASVGNSDQFVSQLASAGVRSTTTVGVSLSGGGVVLDVNAVNGNAAQATSDLSVTVARLRAALEQRQQSVGAPSGSLLRAVELAPPGTPLPVTGNRTKLVGVTGLLGLIVALIAVSLVEGRSRRAEHGRTDNVDAPMEPMGDLTPSWAARPAPPSRRTVPPDGLDDETEVHDAVWGVALGRQPRR
jgi:hypothetical protein